MPLNNFLLAFYVIYFTVFALIGLVIYVFNSLGIMFLANKLGLKNGWLGFIPFASTYKFGQVADECSKRMGERKTYAKLLLAFEIAIYALFIPFIVVFIMLFKLAGIINNTDYYGYGGEFVPGGESLIVSDGAVTMAIFALIILLIYLAIIAVAIVMAVFRYIALYKIFKYEAPNNSVLYIVLSIVFNISWIFLFVTSLKKDISKTDEPILNQPYDYIEANPSPEQEPVYAVPEASAPNVYMPPEENTQE